MRILHVADRLSVRGGAYRHLLGLLEALGEEHEVALAVGLAEERVELRCPVTVVPGLEARDRRPAAIEEVARAFAPDVIHLHTVVNPHVLEWAAGRPALVTVQDHRYFCPTRGKWTAEGRVCRQPMREEVCAACFEDGGYFREVYALTAERLAALRPLRVVVLSRYMKGELEAVGLDPRRIAVVPPFAHGLDPAAFPDGPPCVLFVGRLTASKGVEEAIEAWRLSGLDLPLVVAGTGPLRPAAEAGGAIVLGWLDRGRLSCLFRRARALLLPSRWQEPFGLAGLEALTMGVPVVAWESGSIAEWHPGPGLVAWGDIAGLGLALRKAVEQRAAPPSGFEPAPLMRRLLAIYEDAAGGQGRAHPP